MKLTRGKTYTAPNTVLKVKVLAIHYVSPKGYTKAKLFVTNGVWSEMKNYKLYNNRISHWREVRNDEGV